MAVTFGKLEIDPRVNPAVLDTATWDPSGAWKLIQSVNSDFWQKLAKAVAGSGPLPETGAIAAYRGSCVRHQGNVFLTAGLSDGQNVFAQIGKQIDEIFQTTPIGTLAPDDNNRLAFYATDAAAIDIFVRNINPKKGPRAMGSTPRLGIGTRMSTAHWPGIWHAMHNFGFAADAIQNSLRELNLLDELTAGLPPKTNYQFSFGPIQEGHTGSTFEGLWTAGVLAALKTETMPRYGADADHIMVKRGAAGLLRAKKIIDAARYYSFFTLDVSDILDYGALAAVPGAASQEYLDTRIQDSSLRREVVKFHSQPKHIAGIDATLSEEMIGFMVGKHWAAVCAVEELHTHLMTSKGSIAADVELSIDENPPDVATFDCLTSEIELVFLLEEMKRRGIEISHVAPNFGVEKGVDYRCPDGLAGLEARTKKLYQIATEYGVMLDCHSGDDLKKETRKVFGRATNGKIHFKISPSLQVLFGEVMADLAPADFKFWWDDAMDYAHRAAATGSAFATQCIQEHKNASDPSPAPRHSVFHHFNFATVGRRDETGRFENRERFYTLPSSVYSEYSRRLSAHLCEVAEDVLTP